MALQRPTSWMIEPSWLTRLGSHGFEWWYIQLTAPNFAAVVVIHPTSMMGGPAAAPYVSVTMITGGRVREYRIPFDARSMSWTARRQILISDLVQESDQGWRLSLGGRDWHLSADIQRRAEPWRGLDSLLVRTDTGHEMHWAVPMPRGEWTGELAIHGGRSRLSGLAYQDWNWGSSHLHTFVADWSWYCTADAESSTLGAVVRAASGGKRTYDLSISRSGEVMEGVLPRPHQHEEELVKARRYLCQQGQKTGVYRRKLLKDVQQTQPVGFSETFAFGD